MTDFSLWRSPPYPWWQRWSWINRYAPSRVWVILKFFAASCLTIGIALTQHRVHRGTGDYCILFLRILMIRDIMSCVLQLAINNEAEQECRDIRQF